MGFRVTAVGVNARVPQAIPALLAGGPLSEPVDAHKIQPFYTGLLAKACGLSVSLAMQGDAAVLAAVRPS
jgi:histidine phosphotransferase ChpT